MKKHIIMLHLLLSGIVSSYSRTWYRIQKDNIIINFTENDDDNIALVDDILQDSSVYKCETMNLAGDFIKVPNNFHKLSWMRIMEIISTKPFIIDKQFSSFTRLEALYVFSKIKRIDENVRLPALEEIWFQYSKLKGFPKAVCYWISLEAINIKECNFSTLPKEIDKLQNLEYLFLFANNISVLPDEFYSLKKLNIVNLSHNKLKTISPKICEMENLESICLDENNELKISKTIKDCLGDKLKTLY